MLKEQGQSGPTGNANSGDLTSDLAKVLESHGYSGDRLQQAVSQLGSQAGGNPVNGSPVADGGGSSFCWSYGGICFRKQ